MDSYSWGGVIMQMNWAVFFVGLATSWSRLLSKWIAGAAYDAGDMPAATSFERKIAIFSLVDMVVIVVAVVAMVSTWGV